jgi:hypothetical protein
MGCVEIPMVHRTILREEDHSGKRYPPLGPDNSLAAMRVVGYWTPAHLLEEKQ